MHSRWQQLKSFVYTGVVAIADHRYFNKSIPIFPEHKNIPKYLYHKYHTISPKTEAGELAESNVQGLV